MIVIKLAFIVALCYLFGRGIARESEKEAELAREETENIRTKAKEAYQLMQAEKRVLTNTINELREELMVLKKLDRIRK